MNRLLEPFLPKFDFSVVISCYFEEESIDEFYSRLSSTLEKMGRSYEIIFVNDGSDDRTYEKLVSIFESDPKVSAIVDLYKNAGQANAKTPGVMLAKGRAVVMIDSDLQLDPEELPVLVEAYDAGADIVSGYRRTRKDPLGRRLASRIANLIMRRASGSDIRDFGCTFKIYDQTLVRAFEFGPFSPWRSVPVIAAAKNIVEVPVSHQPRKYGKSGWTFKKLFAYNMEHLVGLSDRPFQILGILCMGLAIVFALRIVGAWFFPLSILPSVTNGLLLNAIVLNFLILLSVLCMIGEFVIRVYLRSSHFPAFVVRTVRAR